MRPGLVSTWGAAGANAVLSGTAKLSSESNFPFLSADHHSGRYLVKTTPVQSAQFSLPVRRDVESPGDDTVTVGNTLLGVTLSCGREFKCLDYATSEAVRSSTTARAQCPILTCCSLEGEIAREAFQ
jgi:hypothetical protein